MALANELVRGWLEQEYGGEVRVDGQRYRRHSVGTVTYHSLCGPIAVRRAVYREVGCTRTDGCAARARPRPPREATPALAASAAQAFAAIPLRMYEQEMAAAHRSRATLERICKLVGERIAHGLPVLEPVLRADERVRQQRARSRSVSIERRCRRGVLRFRAVVPCVRVRSRTVVVTYRMAYVATVATYDRRGETLSTVRLAATAEEGPTELIERLAAELCHLRAQRPTIPIVVIQSALKFR